VHVRSKLCGDANGVNVKETLLENVGKSRLH